MSFIHTTKENILTMEKLEVNNIQERLDDISTNVADYIKEKEEYKVKQLRLEGEVLNVKCDVIELRMEIKKMMKRMNEMNSEITKLKKRNDCIEHFRLSLQMREITKRLIEKIVSKYSTKIKKNEFNYYIFKEDINGINKYLLLKLFNQLYKRKDKLNIDVHYKPNKKESKEAEKYQKLIEKEVTDNLPNELEKEIEVIKDEEDNKNKDEIISFTEYCKQMKLLNIEKYIRILLSEQDIKEILELSKE